jgi:hypothetical protein
MCGNAYWDIVNDAAQRSKAMRDAEMPISAMQN